MMIATRTTIIALIVLVGITAGLVILQVYLSRRESKVPGLILPAVSFVGELFILPNVVLTAGFSAESAVGGAANAALAAFCTLLPTIILLAIYFICRRGKDRKKQLDKMNIQDL